MKQIKNIITCLLLIVHAGLTHAQIDTLRISEAYTTHMIFSSDIIYADLSNPADVIAKVIEQNRNMLAMRARYPFTGSSSVSALESNGQMHTFIVAYENSPERLIVDMRAGTVTRELTASNTDIPSSSSEPPLLSDIVNSRQQLYHIGVKKYGITALCEDIVSYKDVTHIVLSLENKSSVSYSITDATFVLESKKRGKRAVAFEKGLTPKNRHGSLSAESGMTTRMAYSFDKMTLADDQVLKVYLYEEGGQRNLVMTISAKDINKAGASKKQKKKNK